MKQIFLTIILLLSSTQLVSAATPTPEVSTEETRTNSLNRQINDLKDKIASRVAQLKLVDKRGIIGTVTEVKDTQLIMLDQQQKTRIIDIDELTKFSSASAKSTFGISDIAKGETVSVIGLYNKQSRRILGRFVEIATKPTFISGVVSEVDEENFTISVLGDNKTTTTVDIEKITKTNTYEADEITKAGFSKIIPGDRVIVTGYPIKNNKNRITGLRILRLPEAPKHPDISISIPQTQPTTSAR
jgi:hypothetical protein